jgi:hypothetical protein
MAQIFPNMVTKNARGSAPAPIQTKNVAASGTGSAQSVSLTWDSAYPDTTYDVVIGVEAVSGDGSTIDVGGYSKSKTGIVVSLVGGAAQSLILHAVGYSAGPGNS